MRFLQDYDRQAAVQYAHRWAYGRNPAYYDYEDLGGDCTNFASQCVFAGSRIMNFTPTFGWYYIDANQQAPAWTGVEYFWNFFTRKGFSVGPVGEPSSLEAMRPGDIVQLSTVPWWCRWARNRRWITCWWRPTAMTPTTAPCPPMSFGTSGSCTSPAPSGPENFKFCSQLFQPACYHKRTILEKKGCFQ